MIPQQIHIKYIDHGNLPQVEKCVFVCFVQHLLRALQHKFCSTLTYFFLFIYILTSRIFLQLGSDQPAPPEPSPSPVDGQREGW